MRPLFPLNEAALPEPNDGHESPPWICRCISVPRLLSSRPSQSLDT